jgi:hypothetical protein
MTRRSLRKRHESRGPGCVEPEAGSDSARGQDRVIAGG